jgi:hypothetical protein
MRPDLIAGKLPGRLVAALFIIAAHLVVILVSHALLEALEAFGDVPHHRRETVPPEEEQDHDCKQQDVPNAETAHDEKLL